MTIIIKNDDNNHTIGKDRKMGPVDYGVVQLAPYGSQKEGLKCKYVKGKPYTYIKADQRPEILSRVQTVDGLWETIKLPESMSLVGGLLETDPLRNLDVFLDQAEYYAWQDAISNSMEYGNLLLMVSAIEAGDTIKMVRFVFVRLFNIIMDLYKACKKLNVVATYDILADMWLEWRYGWRPLIGEVTAMYELLTADKLYKVKSSYGGRSLSIPDPVTLPLVFCTTSEGRTFTYEPTLSYSSAVSKVGFNYCNTANSRNDDIWAKLGLDAESLLMTAWDLVPFSFIVDMFLNVSAILQVPSQESEVSTFNDYVSRLIHSPRISFKCKSIDGSVPTDLEFKFPCEDLTKRFRDCKKLQLSYWNDPVKRIRLVSPPQPHFKEMSIVERAFGCHVMDCNFVPWEQIVYLPYPLEGHDCNGQQVEDTIYYRYDPTFFRGENGHGEEWLHRYPEITQDFDRLLYQFGPDDDLPYVKSVFKEFFHEVTSKDVAPFIGAFRAELDALQPYNDYYEFIGQVDALNKKYFPLRASNYQQPNNWYVPILNPGNYTVGRLPTKGGDFILNDNLDIDLEKVTLMERKLRKTDQKDRWEVSTELNLAQWADIAIIGEKLVRGRLKYNQIN